MKTLIKTLAFTLTLFSMLVTAEAKGGNKGGKMTEKEKEEQKQKEKEKEAKKAQNEKMLLAVKAVMAVKDKNGDGVLSKDEYLIGEADPVDAAKRFDKFNKNGSHDLEKSEIETSLGF